MSWSLRNHGRSIFVILAVLAVLYGAWWLVIGYWADADSRTWKGLTQSLLERHLFADGLNLLNATPLLYLLLAIVAVVLVFKLKSSIVSFTAMGVAILLTLSTALTLVRGIDDHSAGYAGATRFIVNDTENIPSTLTNLADSISGSTADCKLYAFKGMPGCINEGSFDFDWSPRVASVKGAETVISRSSGSTTNTKLLTSTMTYVYGIGENGVWTAIRDGKSKQPIYGIASWSGEGNVEMCRFTGNYKLDKAFSGTWGRNLSDEIAGKYPNLFYSDTDRWGYCDDDKPVIVIPVKEQVSFAHRTTFRAGGVLVITGSPSGIAQYQHVKDIKPGDFPGPVYPASLAKEQRESMGMIAGVGDSWFRNFGFEATDVATQAGNSSEYQLLNTGDGRTYWVTPMKPRSSDDQVLGAYSVIPADEATSGSLNTLDIHVLDDGDPRAVNLDDLEARVRSSVSQENAGFFPAGGRLAEFLPLNGETWQVYAEIGGRVQYRITVPTDSRLRPIVTSLDSIENGPPPTDEVPPSSGTPDVSACAGDLSSLSDAQLAQCLSALAEELERRQVDSVE